MKHLVLLSGGMDSATALGAAIDTGQDVYALSLKYGSSHQQAEGVAAVNIASYYGIPLHEVVLDGKIFAGSGSALIGESPIPAEEYHDITKETPSVTVVPFRNANLISAAVAIAEARGYDQVWMAVHATDHGGWAYPDCSPEFIGSMIAAVYVGTLRKVRLVAPFLWMSKADIVRVGMKLRVPYEFTYSCYRGDEVSCGECPTCLERLKAFHDAGYDDPIEYK